MNRTTGFAAIVGLSLALLPHAARAADEDTQFWLSATASHAVAEGSTLSLELSQRFRSDSAGGDQQLARLTYDRQVAKGVTLGAGLAVSESGGLTEIRPHQQLTLTTGRLALRTRFEQRFYDDAGRPALRLRQRVQYALPLDKATRLTGAGELLYTLQSQQVGRDPGIDQWRANLQLQHKVNPRLELGIGYLMILAPRNGTPDRLSHVPQATLSLRL
jgi:hypothetical protein